MFNFESRHWLFLGDCVLLIVAQFSVTMASKGSNANKPVKIVAIGDGTVGKTSMLVSYSKGEFPDDYVPTVFENYRTQIATNQGEITLDIWDTAGQEEYDDMRRLAFHNVDVFLVCFSIDNPASLQNLESKWARDISKSESPKAKVCGKLLSLCTGALCFGNTLVSS